MRTEQMGVQCVRRNDVGVSERRLVSSLRGGEAEGGNVKWWTVVTGDGTSHDVPADNPEQAQVLIAGKLAEVQKSLSEQLGNQSWWSVSPLSTDQ